MGEGKPITTPSTPEDTTGSATETHGVNTNLDPNMQGGPTTGADQAATREVTRKNAEQGVPNGTPEPAENQLS